MRFKYFIFIFLLIHLFLSFSLYSQDIQYHAVCVGINDYSSWNDLKYAVADAKDMEYYLINYQEFDEVQTLLNDEATMSNIRNKIWTMPTTSGNTCLFSFSGHGDSQGLGGSNGLITVYEQYITPADLQNWFTHNYQYYNQYCTFLDACGSGCFADYMWRGVITTAVADTEYAWEGGYQDAYGHGVYTYYVLEALKSQKGISAEEVFYYAQPRTIEATTFDDGHYTHTFQHPQMKDNYNGNLSLWTPPPPVPPDPPQNLVMTNAGQIGQSPNLNWNSSSGATNYKIYRTATPVNWQLIGTTTGTSYTDWDVIIENQSSADDEFYYEVTAVNDNGESDPSNIVSTWGTTFQKQNLREKNSEQFRMLPKDYALHQNYPNPFNPTTTIRYELPAYSHVLVTIYNLRGQIVAKLIDKNQDAGYHFIKWEAFDQPSGIYICKMETPKFIAIQKMTILK